MKDHLIILDNIRVIRKNNYIEKFKRIRMEV